MGWRVVLAEGHQEPGTPAGASGTLGAKKKMEMENTEMMPEIHT